MNKRQEYVCGFLFDKELKNILLIEKNRPDYMAGKLTGLGGKIEDNESPLAAMIREFREEAGRYVDNWVEFCSIGSVNHKIYYFYSVVDNIYDVKQLEDEIIDHFNLNDLMVSENLPTMANLKWLLQLSLSIITNSESNKHFKIEL